MSRTAVALFVALFAVGVMSMSTEPVQGHKDGHLIFLRSTTLDTTAAESRGEHKVPSHAIDLYLLHVADVLSADDRASIETAYGLTLSAYVPHNTYVVEASPATMDAAATHPLVTWVSPVPAHAKVDGALAHLSVEEGERIALRALFTPRHRANDAARATALDRIAREGLTLADATPTAVLVHCDAPSLAHTLDVLSRDAAVEWIERAAPRRYLNHEATWLLQSNAETPERPYWAAGLDGAGQIVGIADTGLDTAHCAFGDAEHSVPYAASTGVVPADTEHRKVRAYLTCGDAHDDAEGHGTMVTSSVLGRAHAPLSNLANYDGLARGARVAFADLEGGSCAAEVDDVLAWQYAAGARIGTHAYGEDGNAYSANAAAVDAFVAAHDDFVVVVAAGDAEGVAGASSLSDLATAKNAIAVGSSSNHVTSFDELSLYDRRLCSTFCIGAPCSECIAQFRDAHAHQWKRDSMPAYSAHGPTDDGRIKPDVLAPGRFITAARAGGGSSCLEANRFVALEENFDDADEVEPEEVIASRNVGVASVACGASDGALVFDGSDAGARFAETGSVDVAEGGEIVFDLKLGAGACSAPGAGASLELQYGLFNEAGALEWTTWRTFESADYSAATWGGWNEVFVASDAIATAETRFRLLQANFEDNTPQQDVWLVDNLRITSKATPEGLLRVGEGTSHSAAFVAGAAAVVRQYFVDGFYPSGAMSPTDGFAPSAALVKAAVVNSAELLGGLVLYKNDDESIENNGPVADTEFAQGFGRVVLERGLPLDGDAQRLLLPPNDGEVAVSHGATVVLSFSVVTRRDVQISAVWTDPAAAALAGAQLVNDVDLVVTHVASGATWSGNAHVNGAVTPDTTNNVEQVLLENPVVGEYTITLTGSNVPQGPQNVALVVRGDVRGVPSVGVAPTLVGEAGVNSATVHVDTAALVGLAPATSWVVEVDHGAGAGFVEAARVTEAGNVLLEGLPDSSDIDVRIYGLSADGLTTARVHAPALTFHTLDLLAPDAPIAPTVTFAHGANAKIVHGVPFNNYAPVVGYTLRWRVVGAAEWTEMDVDEPDTLLHRISGLEDDSTYEVQVRALNSVGAGAYSPSATFATHEPTVPARPHAPFVVPGEHSTLHLLVRWNAPLDGGSPITNYLLEMDDGKGGRFSRVDAVAGEELALHRNVTRLRRRLDYKFRIAAVNAEGASAWSEIGEASTIPASEAIGTGDVVETSTGGGDDDSTRRAVGAIFGVAGACMVIAILLHLYMAHHQQKLRLLSYYEHVMWGFVLIGLLAALTGIIWALAVNT